MLCSLLGPDLAASPLDSWLAEQQGELIAQLQLALRATMFSNRLELHPARFGPIAAAEARALAAYLARPGDPGALARGRQLCQAGLGEESIGRLAQTTRRFFLSGAPAHLRLEAMDLVEGYQHAIMRGFFAAHSARILEEQERIRSAIQRAVSRYAVQIAVAADVARAATSILNLDELLQTAVERIHERFGLYYVAIFLADADHRRAYLQASAGEARPPVLHHGDSLRIGEDTLVGWCIAHGEPRIAHDVGKTVASLGAPLLSDIHSEMVIPLASRGRVIGAMAVQSRQVGAFSGQDLAVIRITADQIANGITNARLFRELERQKELAEAASHAKSTFLANMSHELRTPLTSIMGYTDLLQREAQQRGDSTLSVDLVKIHQASERLLAIIDDLLDLSRLDAGEMQLVVEPFDLAELLAEVQVTITPLVRKHRNTLVVHLPDTLGTLRSDRAKIRQIVLNLLGNAAKFTEDGWIILRGAREQQDGQEWVVLSVADTGIGIGRDQLGRLFQEFTQVDASPTRKYGGTGLGLAISRRLCWLMGGTLDVTSVPGLGSTFTARLPVAIGTI